MAMTVPSGELFFTKKQTKTLELASHPRTNIKQYIQVSGCYRRGAWGVGGAFASTPTAKDIFLTFVSPVPTSRGRPWNGGGAAMGKVKSLPRGILSVKKGRGGRWGGAWHRWGGGRGFRTTRRAPQRGPL